MLPFLNKDDTRLLNYALEQAVVVRKEEKSVTNDVHHISFGSDYLYEYRYDDQTFTYKIQNKALTTKIMYLDHPKMNGWNLLDPSMEPKETPTRWRFQIELPAKSAEELVVTMRYERSEYVSISNITHGWIKDRISIYVKNKFINERVRKALQEIADLNEEKAALGTQRDALTQERSQLDSDQNRLRSNLQVLGDGNVEAKLKKRIVEKLKGQENRYEEIKQEIEDIDNKIDELTKTISAKFKKVQT
jgi:prefoldin subunit 5